MESAQAQVRGAGEGARGHEYLGIVNDIDIAFSDICAEALEGIGRNPVTEPLPRERVTGGR